MIILSNSMAQAADEGSLKLATSIVKRIKQDKSETYVISFERECPQSDIHLKLNKFHVSLELIRLLRKKKEAVLYIPFPAPTLSMALRIWVLSFFARYGFQVMMIRQYPMSRLAQLLLRRSGAELIVFSEQAYEYYRNIVDQKVTYLKTGVDTQKFCPVSAKRVMELKRKYGFDPQKPLVLHVGHMKDGRNIASLMDISEDYQILLVISTLSKGRQSPELRDKLLKSGHIRVFDDYLPNIEEIYQMCDVYFFPVQQAGHCIDVPLSCLEAAACGKPVVTTAFGEMKAFSGKSGFYFIDDFNPEYVNMRISEALQQQACDARQHALEYDWSCAVHELTK